MRVYEMFKYVFFLNYRRMFLDAYIATIRQYLTFFSIIFYKLLKKKKKKHLQTFKNCCMFSIKKNRLILPYTALPFRRWWRIVLKTKLQDRSISCAKDMITEPSSQICMFNIIRIGFLFVCLFAIQKQCAQEAGCRLLKVLASLHWQATSSVATILSCVLAKPAQALQFHSLKTCHKIMKKTVFKGKHRKMIWLFILSFINV